MKKVFKVKNMCCPNCAASVERKLNKLPGVVKATINFMMEKLVVEIEEEDYQDTITNIVAVCKKLEPDWELSYE